MSVEKKLQHIAKRINKTSDKAVNFLEKLESKVEQSLTELSPLQRLELYSRISQALQKGQDNLSAFMQSEGSKKPFLGRKRY